MLSAFFPIQLFRSSHKKGVIGCNLAGERPPNYSCPKLMKKYFEAQDKNFIVGLIDRALLLKDLERYVH